MRTSYRDNFVDWNDYEMLQKVISKSRSRVEVLKNLGYYPRSSVSRRKLNKSIKKYKLDISSFTNRTERWEILPSKIKECYNIADVLRAVGLQDRGGNFGTAKKMIEELKLDTSHFYSEGYPKKGGGKSNLTDDEIFCKDSMVHGSTLRKRMLKEDIFFYECKECGIVEWNGQKLVLEVDHINGIRNDNRLVNLRFLCPNCHSLTPTHRGKNNKGKKIRQNQQCLCIESLNT